LAALGLFLEKTLRRRSQILDFRQGVTGRFRHHSALLFLLEGRQFQLWTDHKPLVAAMTRVTPPHSARQQRHLAYVSEFTTDLKHTPGTANVVADALSRPPALPASPARPVASPPQISRSSAAVLAPVAALRTSGPSGPQTAQNTAEADVLRGGAPQESPQGPLRKAEPTDVPKCPVAAAQPLDFSALSVAQSSCPDVKKMLESPSLSVVSKQVGTAEIWGDVSTGVFRPLLPPQFRETAVLALHSIHHPGVRATKRLVCSSYCWPKMGTLISTLARNCLHCQKGKIHRHVSLQAAHIPVPARRFSHIHVDLVGPVPRSSGFSYLFTVVDRTTRWPEAIPLASTTAADCAAALLQGWIQRFGVPSTITSDRGPQFTSSLWASLCTLLSISHTQTTAYHPQSNGLVERFHRRLKDALRSRAAGADWFVHLPWVLLGIRSAWREEEKFSPAEAVFGSQLVLPGQFLNSPESPSPSFLADFQGVLAARPPLKTSHHSSPAPVSLPEELLLTRFVLVRHDGVQPPLSPLYDGPFLVLERSLHFFKLQVGSRQETVSTHRLKPCHAPQDAQAAVPPRRGRPPVAAAAPLSRPSLRSCLSIKGSNSALKRSRHVTFSCSNPSPVSSPSSSPSPSLSPGDALQRRSSRSVTRPARYSR